MFFAPTLDRRQPVVLITHGSMNPVHRGHVEMMVRARSALEAEGFHVVLGIMGITDSTHIRRKGTEPLSDAMRLRLLELATEPHNWLRHCNGHGVNCRSAFQLGGDLADSLQGAHVAYVQGSDVFQRHPPRKHASSRDLLVVVSREGDKKVPEAAGFHVLSQGKVRYGELRSGAGRVLILPPSRGLAATSSTRVREAAMCGNTAAVVEMCGEAVAFEFTRHYFEI